MLGAGYVCDLSGSFTSGLWLLAGLALLLVAGAAFANPARWRATAQRLAQEA